MKNVRPRWLILIKHAMPEIDLGKPASEWPLSDAGRAAGRTLASVIASEFDFTLKTICSSPEPKALKTASLLADGLNLPIKVHPDLHEHTRPLAPSQSKNNFQVSVAAFFNQPEQVVFGSESANQAYFRFSLAVYTICAQETGDVCIVSHGTVISLLAARRCGLDGFALWQRLGLPSIVTIRLPDYHIGEVIEKAA